MSSNNYYSGEFSLGGAPSSVTQPIFENGRSSITQEKHGSGSGVSDLDVKLTQSPGKLAFDYNITGNLEVSFGNFANFLMGKGKNATTAHLVVTPTRITNIQQNIQNKLISGISSKTGIPSQFFKGQIGVSLPSGSKIQQSIPISLKASANSYFGGGVHEAGHSPVTGRKTITFPTIKVPAPENVDLEKLIPESARPKITFTVKPKSVLYNVVRNRAEVTFTLDPGLFIEKVNLSSFPCDQIFQSVGNNISSVKSSSTSLRSEIDSYAKKVESIKKNVLSHSTVSRIESIAPSNISGLGSNELSNIKSELNRFSNYKNKLSNVKSEYQKAKNRVSNITYNRCNSNMGGELSNVHQDITHIESKINSIEKVVSRLKDVLSNVSGLSCGNRYGDIQSAINKVQNNLNMSSPSSTINNISIGELENNLSNIKNVRSTVQNHINKNSSCFNYFMGKISSIISSIQSAISNIQGGCGQISKSILNQITQFNVNANQFSSLPIQRRTISKYHSLINDGENLLKTINNSISNSNPCKQKKLSQVHNALSKIKNSGPRSKQSLPCSDQYSNIENEIRKFENEVNSLSAPITPKELTNLAKHGRKIRRDIEHNIPAGDPCRQSMIKKVSVLINHANNLRPHVRTIVQKGKGKNSSRQNKLLQQLLNSLNNISTHS